MVNIAAYADFTGDAVLILNTGSQSKLTEYITRFQKEALEMLLGLNMYADFDEGISETTPDAKWTKLRDGEAAYYTYNGYKYKYTGLKKLIVYYVYYKWVTIETSSQTNQGETKDLSTNGESIFNISKVVNAYNRFIDLRNEAINYIEYKNSVEGSTYYEDFDPTYLEYINSFGI